MDFLTDFDRVWNVYPRRVGKKEARKAWDALKPNHQTVREILEALQWQSVSKDWQKDGGKFCPHLSTYLRGERWTDERPQILPEHRSDRLAGLREFIDG